MRAGSATRIADTRLELPPQALELVAARFRALGEPIRLRILQTLERGESSVSALALAVGSTQPNVSKHLRLLQDVGLVARRQQGSTVLCSIADPMVFDLCAMVCSGIRDRLEAQVGAFSAPPGRGGRR